MTLTLDEVRKTRFHMARRAGYEVTDVDNFVDKVEATMMHLVEENETLKQQLSTISTSEPSNDLTDENARLRRELEEARKAAHAAPVAPRPAQGDGDQALRAEVERLRKENEELRNRPAPAPVAAPMVQQQGGDPRVERVVVTTSDQASQQVVRLVALATQQAEQVVTEAESEAKRTLDQANRQAHEITVDARTKAERVESEARVNAEKLNTDARRNADNLEREVAQKRAELFSQLESERDRLAHDVEGLRGFESSYRTNLTQHLKSQIDALEKGVFEPGDKPSLLGQGQPKQEAAPSATPRLDALLADNK